MKIKQEDIAKELGVSRTTVARALNGGKIKEETKVKILDLIEKKGYKKNIISSSLAMKKNKVVYCFLVKSLNENYCGELKRGLLEISDEFKEYGFKIKIMETLINEPQNQIDSLIEIIEEKRPSGIIITPLLKKEIKEIILKYEDEIKFITLDIPIDEDEIHVGADYYNSGKVAAGIIDQILRKEEKVLLFQEEDDNISSNLYYYGFKDRIEKSDKKLIEYDNIGKDFYKIKNIIEKTMEKDEIFGIYIPRYMSELLEFFRENNIDLKNIKMVGNGNSSSLKNFLELGNIIAVVQEQNYLEGYTAGKFMFEYLYRGILPQKSKYKTLPIIIFKE